MTYYDSDLILTKSRQCGEERCRLHRAVRIGSHHREALLRCLYIASPVFSERVLPTAAAGECYSNQEDIAENH